PFLGSGRTSDFSGSDRVISTKSATLEPRRPGVVGLYFRIAIRRNLDTRILGPGSADRAGEDVDALALGHGHNRALGVRPLAHTEAGPAALALAVVRVDAGDLDVEHLLDSDLDLGLVRMGCDHEGVLVLVEQPVTLLGHDRDEQDVARILDGAHLVSSSALAVRACPATKAFRASWVNTTSSAHSTSYVLSWSATIRCTCGTLRRLFTLSSSPRSTTTSTFLRSVRFCSVAMAVFVEGVSPSTKRATTWTRPWRARSDSAPRSAAAFIFFGVRWA